MGRNERKPYTKSTNAEVDDRVGIIYTLLLNGLPRREIIQYVKNKTNWNSCDSMIDRYIKKATIELKTHRDMDLKGELAISLKRHEDLYFRAVRDGDTKTALAVQKSRDAITGVTDQTQLSIKSEISGPNGSPIAIRTEDVIQSEEFKNKLESLFELRSQRYKK